MNGLSILDFKEITRPMLLDREIAVRYHSIQDDTTPIFYFMILKKL